ncbi:MAG: DUF4935 domain-containing protein, partial [Chitinophagaceae bacterium]|nr:DUF4935 domain-containing protein [Chitinophagaceae bacterium]
MKYLLIDTSCWIELLRFDERGKLLEMLEFWKNENLVNFLVPQVIMDQEWPSKKQIYIEEVRKAQQTTARAIRDGDEVLPALLRRVPDNDALDKLKRVEALVAGGIYYKYSRKVMADIVEKERKKQPPFHNKATSNGDALIYFSTIECLTKKGIREFIFITANTKDFSDPSDKSRLHPGLEVNGFSISYYTNINLACHKLLENLPSPGKPEGGTDKDYTKQFILAHRQHNSHLIDELDKALQAYHDQIPFVPLHFFHRIFPIKVIQTKDPYTDYSCYTLISNNKELIDMLVSVEVGRNGQLRFEDKSLFKGVPHYAKKIGRIYYYLNQNLVGSLQNTIRGSKKSIQLSYDNVCDCSRCRMQRFDFSGGFKQLIFEPCENFHDTMREAYAHALCGNYPQAFRMFYSVYKTALEKEKYILYFICLTNLKRIKNYMRGYSMQVDADLTAQLGQIENTSVQQEMLLHHNRSRFEIENIQWLVQESFYTHAHVDITEVLRKIRDHYYLQQGTGWSSNSNLRTLICRFAQFEEYLEKNFIFYHPNDVNNLFEEVLEGLLMSSTFNEKQSSRLQYFDDYLLTRIVRYARPETVFKYFRQLHVPYLRYKAGKNNKLSIGQMALQFFMNYRAMNALAMEKIPGEAFYFHTKKVRTLQNLLVVIAVTEIDVVTIQKIAKAILDICRHEKLFRKTEHKYLAEFLSRKGKYLSSATIKELINLIIHNEQFHEGEIGRPLQHLVNKYFPELIIKSRKQYEAIVTNFVNQCPKCKQTHHSDLLLYIYRLLNPTFKKDLQGKITELLKKEFSQDNYYYFAIYELIDYREFWDIYCQAFQKPPDRPLDRQRTFFDQGEVVLTEFSKLLNLAFKYK